MANGFGLSGCDMDLCCLLPLATDNLPKPDIFVTKLGQLIINQTDFKVKILARARIPIIKLELPDGLSCDIGFENRLALENTRLLLT
jgi:terminal uridylyltransferase